MALNRGDVVLVAEGKPRPAVVVQADAFATPTNVLACPLTSDLSDTTLYRVILTPSGQNGLRLPSQAMTDRVGPVRRDRIGAVIGRLGTGELQLLDDALALILGLND